MSKRCFFMMCTLNLFSFCWAQQILLYKFIFLSFSGLTSYLNVIHNVYMPPSRHSYCVISNASIFTTFLCSNLLILSMTFERFYSIIRPHKAVSFNTVKKAKITILIIVIFTISYNIPHVFISSVQGRQCLPYGTAMGKPYGEFYYWLSFVISYALPFVLLLIMNSVIIHKLRNRSNFIVKQSGNEGQGQSESKPKVTKMKTPDKQVYAILLLLTFGFLILTTPGYLLFLFIMVVDFRTSPKMFAGYYLFYNVAQKMHYTNHGINFFLYVISGQKFRTDLLNLFRWNMKGGGLDSSVTNSMEI